MKDQSPLHTRVSRATDEVSLLEEELTQPMADEAWLSVIQKMDEAYAELVQSQVEIEEKNQALEDAKSFTDSIRHAMHDALIAVDLSGQIEQVNRALENLLGVEQDSLIGSLLEEWIIPNDIQRLTACIDQVKRGVQRDVEVMLQGAREVVPLSFNVSARLDHRQRLIGLVLVGRPLGELQKAYKELNDAHAELKLAQERLIQAEKMASLGRLVAGVAHELNNPISFVYGNMHALERYTTRLIQYFDAIQEGQSREALRDLRESMRLDKAVRDLNSLVEGTKEGADRVREIVNDLRQFSSTQESEKAPFDLVHVVKTALHWIVKESKVAIQIDLDTPTQLWAIGHSGQIHQVVVNLIQNAVDAMQQSPEPSLSIHISFSDKPAQQELGETEPFGSVHLCIKDTGTGVDKINMDKLFDPFFTTKPVGQGTGLGLSISYGIVTQHHGVLTIKNREEHEGVSGVEACLIIPAARSSSHQEEP